MDLGADFGGVGNIHQAIAIEVVRAIAVSRPLLAIGKMSSVDIRKLGRTIISKPAPASEKNPALKDAWNLLFAVEVVDHLWQFRDDALNWIKAIESEAVRRKSLAIKRGNYEPTIETQLQRERDSNRDLSRNDAFLSSLS
jgi:hypothetical protein